VHHQGLCDWAFFFFGGADQRRVAVNSVSPMLN
jgi:hypothetical protein